MSGPSMSFSVACSNRAGSPIVDSSALTASQLRTCPYPTSFLTPCPTPSTLVRHSSHVFFTVLDWMLNLATFHRRLMLFLSFHNPLPIASPKRWSLPRASMKTRCQLPPLPQDPFDCHSSLRFHSHCMPVWHLSLCGTFHLARLLVLSPSSYSL